MTKKETFSEKNRIFYLDQQNKGQNIVSTVGLLLKGLQEATTRIMELERRIYGKDFVTQVGFAHQTNSFEATESLADLDNNIPVDGGTSGSVNVTTPDMYGLMRLIRVMALAIFGTTNPNKKDIAQIKNYNPTTHILKLLGGVNVADIQADVAAIKVIVENIQRRLNLSPHTASPDPGAEGAKMCDVDIQQIVEGIKKGIPKPGQTTGIYDQTNTLENIVKLLGTGDSVINTSLLNIKPLETRLKENTPNSLLNKIIKTIQGDNTNVTLTSITTVLNNLKNNDREIIGKITGTAVLKGGVGDRNIEFPEGGVKIAFTRTNNADSNLPFVTVNPPPSP